MVARADRRPARAGCGSRRRGAPPLARGRSCRGRGATLAGDDEVLFACRTFLSSEAGRTGEAEPVAFEVAFGIRDDEHPAEFPDPVEIALGGGRSFRLRGSIDRVDRDAGGKFLVWDYKTGASM